METPEQMDERRARTIFEWGVGFPKWEEHKFQQSGFYLKSLQQAKDVRASDASAGLVSVPVEEILAQFPLFDDEGLDEEKHHCEWCLQQDRKRLHAILRQAQAQETSLQKMQTSPDGQGEPHD